MNKAIIILLTTLLPFFTFGQNSTNQDKCATNLEKQIETTLLNDVRRNEDTINVNLDKSYSLTIASMNTQTVNVNGMFEFNTDKLQKGIRSLRSDKFHFSEPFKVKGLFEN